MTNRDKKKSFEVISENEINLLIKNTKDENKSWHRICLHKNANSKMHSMVMCMNANVESGFHYNKNSIDKVTYSYLGYSFQVKIMELNNSNNIEVINIDKSTPIVSIEDSTSRSIVNNSDQTLIYLEHRAGPYIKEEIMWLD